MVGHAFSPILIQPRFDGRTIRVDKASERGSGGGGGGFGGGRGGGGGSCIQPLASNYSLTLTQVDTEAAVVVTEVVDTVRPYLSYC